MSERRALALAGRRSGDIGGPSRPRAVAATRRPGTAGGHRRSLNGHQLNVLKAWAPWHGQDGDFSEEEASAKIARLYHNVQPFGQAGSARSADYCSVFGGIGFGSSKGGRDSG